jgi:hypothetical protein
MPGVVRIRLAEFIPSHQPSINGRGLQAPAASMALVSQIQEAEHFFAHGRERALLRAQGLERLVEVALALGFLVVALAMALLLPSPRALDMPTLAILIGAYVICSRAKFDIADGYTVPTELVLVPMLFLLPTPAVPLVVACSDLLGRGYDYASGHTNVHRSFHTLGDCWYAVGPALVLVAAGAQIFSWEEWPIYLVALLAQFAFDFVPAAIRERVIDGVSVRMLGGLVAPVYALDGALAPIGLLVAFAATQASPAVALLIVPLATVLAVLSRERQARVDQALELSSAYRGRGR